MSTGLYGHKNALATYLLLHFPLSIYFFFYSESNNKKYLAGVLSILILLGLIFSKSRGGQLVLIIQITSILAYFYLKKDYTKILGLFVGFGLTTGYTFKYTFFSQRLHLCRSQIGWEDHLYGRHYNRRDSNAWGNLANRLIFWHNRMGNI